ncbi:MAG: prepilin peptidase [Deltaproteobacteria bacterium]|nr:prepilin peptidase [Deltaproteobacteria bacterium]
MEQLANLTLMLGLAIAVVTDIREGKIYNLLTGPLIGAGLLFSALGGHLTEGLIGLVAAFALHFLLFALQVDRGGDAKLMMAVGAFLGWQEMVEATLFSFVFFLPVGVWVLFIQGKLGRFWAALRWTLLKAMGSPLAGDRPEPTVMIKAPSIMAGTVLAMYTQLLVLS